MTLNDLLNFEIHTEDKETYSYFIFKTDGLKGYSFWLYKQTSEWRDFKTEGIYKTFVITRRGYTNYKYKLEENL